MRFFKFLRENKCEVNIHTYNKMEYSPLSNAKKRNLKLIQKKCKTDARKESKPPKKSKKNHHRREKSPRVAEKVRAKFRDIGAATEKRLILDKGENAGLFNQGTNFNRPKITSKITTF